MQHQHESQQDSFKNANEGTGLIKDSSLHTIKSRLPMWDVPLESVDVQDSVFKVFKAREELLATCK